MDDEDVQDVKEQRDAAQRNNGICEPPARVLEGGKAVGKVEELLSYGGRDPTGW
jgi:hypothetical protein